MRGEHIMTKSPQGSQQNGILKIAAFLSDWKLHCQRDKAGDYKLETYHRIPRIFKIREKEKKRKEIIFNLKLRIILKKRFSLVKNLFFSRYVCDSRPE
jgi:hypothetical protein